MQPRPWLLSPAVPGSFGLSWVLWLCYYVKDSPSALCSEWVTPLPTQLFSIIDNSMWGRMWASVIQSIIYHSALTAQNHLLNVLECMTHQFSLSFSLTLQFHFKNIPLLQFLMPPKYAIISFVTRNVVVKGLKNETELLQNIRPGSLIWFKASDDTFNVWLYYCSILFSSFFTSYPSSQELKEAFMVLPSPFIFSITLVSRLDWQKPIQWAS